MIDQALAEQIVYQSEGQLIDPWILQSMCQSLLGQNT